MRSAHYGYWNNSLHSGQRSHKHTGYKSRDSLVRRTARKKTVTGIFTHNTRTSHTHSAYVTHTRHALTHIRHTLDTHVTQHTKVPTTLYETEGVSHSLSTTWFWSTGTEYGSKRNMDASSSKCLVLHQLVWKRPLFLCDISIIGYTHNFHTLPNAHTHHHTMTLYSAYGLHDCMQYNVSYTTLFVMEIYAWYYNIHLGSEQQNHIMTNAPPLFFLTPLSVVDTKSAQYHHFERGAHNNLHD